MRGRAVSIVPCDKSLVLLRVRVDSLWKYFHDCRVTECPQVYVPSNQCGKLFTARGEVKVHIQVFHVEKKYF